MQKVAILVDGGYYRKVALKAFGNKSAEESADELVKYCLRHLKDRRNREDFYYELYRIFYYDCPPLSINVHNPLTGKSINMKKNSHYTWMNNFLKQLTRKRKLALRLGNIAEKDVIYNLKPGVLKKLINGTIDIKDISIEDLFLDAKQKGVDMKIGVDIASLAYKKLVDKIILISGDSDFVPASKLARREGIDFVLDALGNPIKDDLFEHIDGLKTCDQRLREKYNK